MAQLDPALLADLKQALVNLIMFNLKTNRIDADEARRTAINSRPLLETPRKEIFLTGLHALATKHPTVKALLAVLHYAATHDGHSVSIFTDQDHLEEVLPLMVSYTDEAYAGHVTSVIRSSAQDVINEAVKKATLHPAAADSLRSALSTLEQEALRRGKTQEAWFYTRIAELAEHYPTIALSSLLPYHVGKRNTGPTALGRNGETGERIFITDTDRQSGMYVMGIQGSGKSSFLETLIHQDICKGYAVIVLDPHGDLINHAIAQMPKHRVKDTYLLDIEDIGFPFGLNLLTVEPGSNDMQEAQALDRLVHVFEKSFPDTSHMLLEKYLGNLAPVFFANPGYTLAEVPKFLRDDELREMMLGKVRNFFVKEFWEEEYSGISASKRQSETASLATRLNRFIRSPIVGNIIGQSQTTIDFRRAIERKEIVFIRLPIKTLKEDAGLIGTMLIAAIHAATFSFGDLPLGQRPGFSLYADEFQHFATSDFNELFTEGRKFGSRVVVAHQYRNQVPQENRDASLTAYTNVIFQTTPDDSSELASLFTNLKQPTKKEEMERDAVTYLLTRGHPHPKVREFIETYLRPLEKAAKMKPTAYPLVLPGIGHAFNPESIQFHLSERLNMFLYQIMVEQNAEKDIPGEMLCSFGCALGFFGSGPNDLAEQFVKELGNKNARKDITRALEDMRTSVREQLEMWILDFEVVWQGFWQYLQKSQHPETQRQLYELTTPGHPNRSKAVRSFALKMRSKIFLFEEGERDLILQMRKYGVEIAFTPIPFFEDASSLVQQTSMFDSPYDYFAFSVARYKNFTCRATDALSRCFAFLGSLRAAMQVLANEPVPLPKPLSKADIADILKNLSRRTALSRVGREVAIMQTLNTPPPDAVSLSGASKQEYERLCQQELENRKRTIQSQTRRKYCRPRSQVEQEIQRRSQREEEEPVAPSATQLSPSGKGHQSRKAKSANGNGTPQQPVSASPSKRKPRYVEEDE